MHRTRVVSRESHQSVDTGRIIIHAINNCRSGGGRTLLLALLRSLPPHVRGVILVDARLDLGTLVLPAQMELHPVGVSIRERLAAEWRLRRLARAEDVVLCLGNLPPLFDLRCRVLVFVQNRHLVEQTTFAGDPLPGQLRGHAERLWLRCFGPHASDFIVQSASMAQSLRCALRTQAPIHIAPFVPSVDAFSRRLADPPAADRPVRFDFVYVSSGERHKNHRNLILAWIRLAEEGLYPSLCLTINPRQFSSLWAWIEGMITAHSLRIENLGQVTETQVGQLYRESRALIYPSTLESLGLPLIEARREGLPIVAAELDYVRDLLDPEQTFDPQSPTSIARAVKRHMGIPEDSLPLLDAEAFLTKVVGARSLVSMP